jgi:hypothetical protein
MSNIFISHIAEEKALALIIKKWVETSFLGQYDVFVSSDIRDLPAGKKWLSEIDKALHDSIVFLVLCSSKSISRPWVNFESGCAFMRGVDVIPLCHSGVTKGNLPSPLSIFQALEIDSPSFVMDFLSSLAKCLNISTIPIIDQKEMVKEITKAISEISIKKDPLTPQIDSIEISEDLIDVLKTISDQNDEGFSVEELAQSLNKKTPKMQYYLDCLFDKDLILVGVYIDGSREYKLSPNGRSLLVKKGLL